MKVPVRNHMSILDDQTVARVRRAQAGGRDVPSGGALGPSDPAAAAAPPGAQAAATAPGAPPKEKPTIRFADVRKTPRYEPKAGEEAGAPRVPPEPAPPSIATEPARAEPVRPAEPSRAIPEAAPAAASPAAPAAPQPLRYLELDGPIQVGDLASRMGVP